MRHTVLNLFIRSQPSDKSCPPFPDQNFNGAGKVCTEEYSMQCVFHSHQMWMQLILWGFMAQRKVSEETKSQRKTLIQRSFRQSLQHQKTTKVQRCAEHCVSFFQQLFTNGKAIVNAPKTSLFWLERTWELVINRKEIS